MTTAMGTMHGLTESIGRDIDAGATTSSICADSWWRRPASIRRGAPPRWPQVVRRYLTGLRRGDVKLSPPTTTRPTSSLKSMDDRPDATSSSTPIWTRWRRATNPPGAFRCLSSRSRDGRLYGLGMGNMKGALAAMCLAAAIAASPPQGLERPAVDDGCFRRGHVWRARHGVPSAQPPRSGGRFPDQRRRPGLHGLRRRREGFALGRHRGARGARPFVARAAREHGGDEARGRSLAARRDQRSLRHRAAGTRPASRAATAISVCACRSMPARSRPAPCAARSRPARRPQLDFACRRESPPRILANRIRSECAGDPDIGVTITKAWDANWAALQNPLVVELAAAAQAVRGTKPTLRRAPSGQRCPALARPRRAGRLLRPAADALGRHR